MPQILKLPLPIVDESVVGVSRSPSSLMPPARGDESHRHEVMDVTDPAYPPSPPRIAPSQLRLVE